MIAASQDIDLGGEQLLSCLRGQSSARRCILDVPDHQFNFPFRSQPGHFFSHYVAARTANNVTDEQHSHD
jgi:hypothetical protein